MVSATLPSAGVLRHQALGSEPLRNWFILQRSKKKKPLVSCPVFQPLVLVTPGLHSSDLVRVRVSPQTLGKYTLAVDNVCILLQSDDVLEVTVS